MNENHDMDPQTDDVQQDVQQDVTTDPQDDTTRQDVTEPQTPTASANAEGPQQDAETTPDETGDPQDDDIDTDDPAVLRAKLEKRTLESIKLRKRAQQAETALAALKAEAVAWQRDRVSQSETLMGSVRPDARADVLDSLAPQQIAALYNAARLSPERVRRAYQPHATRRYVNAWKGDSFGTSLSTDPEDVQIRETIDAARAIITDAVGDRQYLRASAVQTPDLTATLKRQNGLTAPKTPEGNALARALQRH